MNNEIKAFIMAEVKRQTVPLLQSLREVQEENKDQSAKLNGLRGKIDSFDHWSKSLWGNGSGQKGFLERARAEDRETLDDLKNKLNDLIAKDQQALGVENFKRRQEATRSLWYSRLMDFIKIAAGSGLGAYLLEHIFHLHK